MRRFIVAATLLVVFMATLGAGASEEKDPRTLGDLGLGRPEAQGDLRDGAGAVLRGDYATALREWRPLAEQGNATAQTGLGLMYSEGHGVPQDYVQAHMWFNLGAVAGDKTTAENRNLVAGKMTPAQIAEAQRLARDWQPKKQ